ncbi:hypothetical protein NDU88_006563, partial [Pleurodeles waltl]
KSAKTEVSTQNSDLVGMTKWAHQRCGHLGEKATYRSYYDSPLTMSVLCGLPSGVCVWGQGGTAPPT